MLLDEAEVPAFVCDGLPSFCARLGENALFAILTEEALLGADLRAIARYVNDQAPLVFAALHHPHAAWRRPGAESCSRAPLQCPSKRYVS